MNDQRFLRPWLQIKSQFPFFLEVEQRGLCPLMLYTWNFSNCHTVMHSLCTCKAQTPVLSQFRHETISCPFTFPGNLLSHWAETKLTKTIGTVWWSWQRTWEVIKMVLTHYFKQTERAPMRGIKEREEIWQGSTGRSPKEAIIFCRRNHPAGMKPVNNSETSEQENIHKYLIFEVHMHIFFCHA